MTDWASAPLHSLEMAVGRAESSNHMAASAGNQPPSLGAYLCHTEVSALRQFWEFEELGARNWDKDQIYVAFYTS